MKHVLHWHIGFRFNQKILQKKACLLYLGNCLDSVETNCLFNKVQGEHKVRPYGTRPDSLGRAVQGFKSKTTHEYIGGVKQKGWTPFTGKLWQRNYYDHIVRENEELNRIRKYISDNPRRWEMDRENPEGANYQNKSGTAE